MKLTSGGMTTALYDKGFYINRSFEELSLTEPDSVKAIYEAYVDAGSEILFTNTFGANTPKLTEFGLESKLEDILKASTKICKKVVNSCNEESVKGEKKPLETFGLIGPLGSLVEPLGKISIKEAQEYFSEIIKIFLEEGVDGICFQGFHDLNELKAAVDACVRCDSQIPIMTQFSIQENMCSAYGHTLMEFVKSFEPYKSVFSIGICGEVGPSGALSALEILKPLTHKDICILPNAGLPRYVNDQYIYMSNPDYLAKHAKRYAQKGAKIIGGGSGVHAEHIKAMAMALKMLQFNPTEISNNVDASKNTSQNGRLSDSGSIFIQDVIPKNVYIKEQGNALRNNPLEQRTHLGEKLQHKDPVITVEVMPPKGIDFESFYNHCEELENAGVDFINIPDGARAMARMSSLQTATYIKNNFKKLEPIPHFTARDRNLLGIQGDLLGAHINNVRNLLLVTGDPPKLGNCPGATGVYDVDAIGLTHIVSRFNQGLGLGGAPFGDPTDFVIGVALNPTASHQELEIQRFKYKIEAGARYAITQPIYSVSAYEKFMNQIPDNNLPIIMGIWPLVSLRNAEFLKNEVPGVEVPDDVIEKMKKVSSSKEDSLKMGLEIAIDVIEKAKPLVAGFQVSAPFNKVDFAVSVIKNCHFKTNLKEAKA